MGWSEFINLGGKTFSAPGAWTHQGVTFVIVRGTNDDLWERRSSNGVTFTDWAPHADGRISSAPVLYETGSGELQLIARGLDGKVWRKPYRNGAWQSFECLGGQCIGEPAAAPGVIVQQAMIGGTSIRHDTLDLFCRGTDNKLWHRRESFWGGHDWECLDPTEIISAPAACSTGGGKLVVMACLKDNQLYEKRYEPETGWTHWLHFRDWKVGSRPSARSFNAGFHEYVISDITYKFHFEGRLSAYQFQIGGSMTDPVVDSRGGDHRQIFCQLDLLHPGPVYQRVYTTETVR